MFTGIIEQSLPVQKISNSQTGQQISINVKGFPHTLNNGQSVAVNGVCLTVVSANSNMITFNIIPETLRKTNLGQLKPGDQVNIERSLKAGDPIDGHFVLGHIDTKAKVTEIQAEGEEYIIWVSIPDSITTYITQHGSIAINGTSLTIARVEEDKFAVALIPTTLERTNLGMIQVDDDVNIEADYLAKQVHRFVSKQRREP